MEVIVEVGAGLDVHKKRIVACCIDGRSNPVKITRGTFGTYRPELEQLRSWLQIKGCTHVAMESTGVYWLPVYRVLEGGVTVVLGNARHKANVPGRKTDVSDAEWIAQLLRHGLIRPSFVPPRDIRELRQLTRFRRKLVQTRTASQLRVEKLLQATNMKLSSVVSEVFGVSGRRIMTALVEGVREGEQLAELSRGKLRKKRHDLALALSGSFSDEDGRLLGIQLGVIEQVEAKLSELNALIEQKTESHRSVLDLLQTIPGFGPAIAVDVLAEVGPDMSHWPSDRHFVAWSGTCPGNRESAGVRRQAVVRNGNSYLTAALGQAAAAATRIRGGYLARRYQQLRRRRGERRAMVAVARELALAVYHVLKTKTRYRPPAVADPEVLRTRRRNQLMRELRKLGVQISVTQT